MQSDPLHPNGRCRCAGEGTCDWCLNHCGDCGLEKSLHPITAPLVKWAPTYKGMEPHPFVTIAGNPAEETTEMVIRYVKKAGTNIRKAGTKIHIFKEAGDDAPRCGGGPRVRDDKRVQMHPDKKGTVNAEIKTQIGYALEPERWSNGMVFTDIALSSEGVCSHCCTGVKADRTALATTK